MLMAKKESKNYDKTISDYVSQFYRWRDSLKAYWPQIDKCQQMYEFYKREEGDTDDATSLNTPFAIIESMISKANESNLIVTTTAKGTNDLTDFEEWVSSVLKGAIEDKDIASIKGSFRKIREKFFRELLVKGNAAAKVEYLYKTQVIDGSKKVIADNPYVKVLPLKSVIFNPTRTLVDSNVYYVESYLSFKDLKDNEYDEKNGKGLYKNLGELKVKATEQGKQIDDDFFYSGDKKIAKKIEDIHIIERWEGTSYKVIAALGRDSGVVIREETDPLKIGGHNLLLAMDYQVENRPYGYGEIDPIYKPTIAQDKIVQQSLDIIDNYLRPNVLVRPGSQIDLDELITVINDGGVMYGDPNEIGNIPLQTPPQNAFQTIDVMQQAIERAARFSPYSAGIPSQVTDKTSGTKGGIQALQVASEPNFKVKLDTLEDSFMQPLASMYLKMIGNLMSPTDVRYGLLEGKSKQWVKATKNMLQGKATFQDLLATGFVTEEQVLEYTTTVDEQGNPVPIPGSMEALVIDVDWIIDVKLDNQSAADKLEKLARKEALIDKAISLGVGVSGERVVKKLAEEDGFEDFDELLLTDQEKQVMEQKAQDEKQMQMDAEMQKDQADKDHQMQIEQMKIANRGQNATIKAGAGTATS